MLITILMCVVCLVIGWFIWPVIYSMASRSDPAMVTITPTPEAVKTPEPKEKEYHLGQYKKVWRCSECKWANDFVRFIPEVCPDCGSENLTKVIGRWKEEKFISYNGAYVSVSWIPVEFIPKSTEVLS